MNEGVYRKIGEVSGLKVKGAKGAKRAKEGKQK